MCQALLDKKYFIGIYTKKEKDMQTNNSRGKRRQRNKKTCDIFKNGTEAKVQGTLGKEAQEGPQETSRT